MIPAKDVSILNVALGLEPCRGPSTPPPVGCWWRPAAKPVLDVALLFQSHPKAHRDALIASSRMGGK